MERTKLVQVLPSNSEMLADQQYQTWKKQHAESSAQLIACGGIQVPYRVLRLVGDSKEAEKFLSFADQLAEPKT